MGGLAPTALLFRLVSSLEAHVPESAASQWTATTASKGLFARLIGVLTSPRATYAEVAAQPRWLGALAVVLVVTGVGVGALTSTEVGRRVFLDQQITMMESFGRRPHDAQVLQMEERIAHGPSIGVAGQAVAVVLVIAFGLAAVKTTLSGV